MTEILWPIVALVLMGVLNYRLGQYLNPPYEKKIQEIELRMDAQDRDRIEIQNKVNALTMDRGFGKK